MSIVTHGAVGAFNGRTGDVVTYRWRKLRVGRSAARTSRREKTAKQKNQQKVFGVLSQVLSYFKNEINLGFNFKHGNVPPFGYAMRHNAKCCSLNADGIPVIDFASIQLTKGNLDQVYRVTMRLSAEKNNTIQLNWKNPVHFKSNVSETDVLHLQFFNEEVAASARESALAAYQTEAGARGDSYAEIKVVKTTMSGAFHCWLFLALMDRKQVSKTKYLGKFDFAVSGTDNV